MKLTTDELIKEYCKLHGWERQKGIYIKTEVIDTDYDEFFLEENSEFIREGYAWVNVDGEDEGVYDDDDIIERIEENSDISFENFIKTKKELEK